MQKTPLNRTPRTAAVLMAAAAAMPCMVTIAKAGDGYSSPSSGSGYSSLAEREMIRRQQAVADADRLIIEGRDAYAKGDYQTAVDKYRQAVDKVPDAPAFADRRKSYVQHLVDGSVALAEKYRKVGKYKESRELLEVVLQPNMSPGNPAALCGLQYLDDPIRTNPALTYEHTQNVDKVRRLLYTGEGAFNLGKYDEAKHHFEDVLRIDPYNSAARRFMERVAAAKSDYYRAAYDNTRAELLMQVDRAWETSVPAELPTNWNGDGTPTDDRGGQAYLSQKIRRIVIPVIDFDNTTVEEAADFIRQRSIELDTTETDPSKKGVNIVVRKPRPGAAVSTDAGASTPLGGGDPGAAKIRELRLRNVPIAVALQYICDATKLRFKVDDYAVTIVPESEEGEALVNRTFRVPPDFVSSLEASVGGGGGGGSVADPFASSSDSSSSGNALTARRSVQKLLEESGVKFPEGATAQYTASSSTLVVRNTPTNVDLIEQIIDARRKGTPKQVKITTKFVEIAQQNGEELGFDWLVSPFGLSANHLFGSGGTIGNGTPRTAADAVPVGPTPLPWFPTAGGNLTNIATGGLRSGDGAISGDSISSLINNPNRNENQGSVAPGIAALTGLFSDGQVQLIMRGLSQKKGADLMTAPSITARSGEKATIEIVREFIYPTEYEPPELPNSVGGSGVISTGGLGGSSGGMGSFPVTPATPTAFETRNTGVTLEIEPTIGEGDFVIDLRFAPEIVEFEGFINYGSPIQTQANRSILEEFVDPITGLILQRSTPLPTETVTITENRIEMPVFSSRRVKTQLTIYDGYTVAVGGLMREDVQNVEDKVPIFGDIPIIGRLFQSKAENRIKSNLIIFVTAQIIDATGRPLRGVDAASQAPAGESISPVTADGSVLPSL